MFNGTLLSLHITNTLKPYHNLLHEGLFQLFYVHRGQLIIQVHGQSKILSQGQIILLNGLKKIQFQQVLNQDMNLYAVIFKEHFCGDCFTSIPEFRRVGQLFGEAKYGVIAAASSNQIKDRICEMENNPWYAQVTDMVNILNIFARDEQRTYLCSSLIPLSAATFRIKRIQEYVRANVHTIITLDQLANYVGMNRSSLSRYFRSKTGIGLINYIQNIRIELACDLLQQGRYPIKQIAYQTGFNNLTTFYQTFSKIKATTPNEFKNHLT
ncbi:AraC family transcriptional regulator [Mucilaginibacter sp. 21P]|uniref:helix-turn-helix transcriptional regulator n=1 Tax=Mucilaginibacter sp. 21P TaxID=2778902 RepID=UPI001C57C490|nr:helix-turn-helix transcriptional regulator [Mucilaginibacter sp. 21P]QXV63792.1 AraC family transcriptional regulator [Mucilaginibacter sp. 21P]